MYASNFGKYRRVTSLVEMTHSASIMCRIEVLDRLAVYIMNIVMYWVM